MIKSASLLDTTHKVVKAPTNREKKKSCSNGSGMAVKGFTADAFGAESGVDKLTASGSFGYSAMGVSTVVSGIFGVIAAGKSLKTSSDKAPIKLEKDPSHLRMQKTAHAAENVSEKVMGAVAMATGTAYIASGAVSLISTGFSLAALGTVAKAVTNGAAVLGSVSGVLSAGITLLTAVPRMVTAGKAYASLNKIEKEGKVGLNQLYKLSPKTLKSIAPKTFEAMTKAGGIATDEILSEAKKEIKKTGGKALFASIVSVLAIVGTVLGFVLTAGSGPVIAAVIGLVVSVATTGMDGAAMIQKLKAATKLGKKDLIVKVLTIVLAALTIAGSLAFAPSLGMGIATALVGVAVMGVPIASIAYLKAKEREAKIQADPDLLARREEERKRFAAKMLGSERLAEQVQTHMNKGQVEGDVSLPLATEEEPTRPRAADRDKSLNEMLDAPGDVVEIIPPSTPKKERKITRFDGNSPKTIITSEPPPISEAVVLVVSPRFA